MSYAALTAAAIVCGCSLQGPDRAPEPVPPPIQAPTPARGPPQQQSPQTPQPPYPARPPRIIALSAASSSLVKQAHAQIAHGDLAAASSTLDRALRIEPNNSLLWIELGRLRIAESDPHQAEVCGRKALALASGDRGAQSQASRLVEDALRLQGR
jgi:tetratricopeptide (TPR) repeat protein